MTGKHRILIVDDERRVSRALAETLRHDGFEVSEATTARDMLQILGRARVDAITLDLGLPDEDGLTLLRRIRHVSDVPIVVISGKSDPVDRVLGLEVGADDYVCKPFHLREVVARLRAVIRRRETAKLRATEHDRHRRLAFDGWILDIARRVLTRADGEEQELTGSEFDLLALFAANPGEVLHRDTIMDRLKGRRWSPFDRGIDMQVRRLRQKIEADPARPHLIKTVRGVGYIFAAEVEELPHGPTMPPRGFEGNDVRAYA